MTRYFYTDSLAAAWMAKHFGMVFREKPPLDDGWVDPLMNDRGRYIICPDSMHLLEPRPGDKVSYSFGVGQHAGEAWDEVKGIIASNDEGYPYTGNGEPYVLVDDCDEFPLSRLKEIFQRDGKPFMWPESEVA
jgi:hypothetical protein